MKVTFALGRILNKKASRGSRRKSEEMLHEPWEHINLSELEPSPWWPFLPRWVTDDQVLRQILGLGTRDGESGAKCIRIQKEYENNSSYYLPGTSPASISTFTSFGSDNPDDPILQSPGYLHVEQEHNSKESHDKTGQGSSRNISSAEVEQSYEDFQADRVCSKDRILRERQKGLSPPNDVARLVKAASMLGTIIIQIRSMIQIANGPHPLRHLRPWRRQI